MSETVVSILGATGQVGSKVLSSLLSSQAYAKVHEFGRRTSEPPASTTGLDKRTTHVIDLDKPDATEIGGVGAQTVIITLGTTRANAGSAEAFRKIDQDYVVSFAQAAKSPASQRVIYLSSSGSSLSAPFLYPKSKAQTEKRLSELGYPETIIFKPGFLAGTARPEKRMAEEIFGHVTSFGSRFSDKLQIDINELGHAIVKAGILGVAGLQKAGVGSEQSFGATKTWTISNGEAMRLAKLEV